MVVVLTAVPGGELSWNGVERTGCGARLGYRFERCAVGDHVDERRLARADGAKQKDVEALPLLRWWNRTSVRLKQSIVVHKDWPKRPRSELVDVGGWPHCWHFERTRPEYDTETTVQHETYLIRSRPSVKHLR